MESEYNGIEILNTEDCSIDDDKENISNGEMIRESDSYQSYQFETSQPDPSFDWKNIAPDSPRRKYAEIYQNIDEEEIKILQLEERRKKLENDMELLQQEIEYEKMWFREAIDFEIERKHEITPRSQYSAIKETVVNPLKLDKDEIKSRLKEYQRSLDHSKAQSYDIHEQDPDIERFKTNLQDYRNGLNNLAVEQISKEKRKAAEKVFEKHFQQVEEKCAQQIDYLENIQKSIEKEFCAKKL